MSRARTRGPDAVDKSAQDTTDASLTPALDRYALRSVFACFGFTFGAHRSEPQATSNDDLGEECQICMDQARGCGLALRFPAVSYALRHQVATLTLLPCKHDGLCLNCLARVSRCPFCRARVDYVCDIDGTTSIHVPPACPLDEDRMLHNTRAYTRVHARTDTHRRTHARAATGTRAEHAGGAPTVPVSLPPSAQSAWPKEVAAFVRTKPPAKGTSAHPDAPIVRMRTGSRTRHRPKYPRSPVAGAV
jgi:hypothetical protein